MIRKTILVCIVAVMMVLTSCTKETEVDQYEVTYIVDGEIVYTELIDEMDVIKEYDYQSDIRITDWYFEETYTYKYDFSRKMRRDVTLYAKTVYPFEDMKEYIVENDKTYVGGRTTRYDFEETINNSYYRFELRLNYDNEPVIGYEICIIANYPEITKYSYIQIIICGNLEDFNKGEFYFYLLGIERENYDQIGIYSYDFTFSKAGEERLHFVDSTEEDNEMLYNFIIERYMIIFSDVNQFTVEAIGVPLLK